MTIAKKQVMELINDMPDEVDVEELIYRIYIRQKLEAAEKDIADGNLIDHEDVVQRMLDDEAFREDLMDVVIEQRRHESSRPLDEYLKK